MERVRYQQVDVSGDDGVGLTAHHKLQELVVVGISAGLNRCENRNPFGDAAKETELLLAILERDEAIELGAGENIGELRHRRLGDKKLAFVHDDTNRLPGYGMWQKEPTDERVGVDEGCAWEGRASFGGWRPQRRRRTRAATR